MTLLLCPCAHSYFVFPLLDGWLSSSKRSKILSAVYCVFPTMGLLRYRSEPNLTVLPLNSPPLLASPLFSWQSAAVTTTGDAADHMTSWPSLSREKHSCWYTQAQSHARAHSLTGKHRSRHTLTRTHPRTHKWYPSTLPCRVTAQPRWASLSMSPGSRASWLVHLFQSSVLIGYNLL